MFKKIYFTLCLLVCVFQISSLQAHVKQEILVGLDQLFEPQNIKFFDGKRIGIVTNHTGINKNFEHIINIFKKKSDEYSFRLVALFAPEHGLNGMNYAWEHLKDETDKDKIPIFSLHGKTRRPTKRMLEEVDLLIYDIQDVGSRSYTYISTLFYVMEEAAKYGKEVLVLDRPNPINGVVIDGLLVKEKWRSYVGYLKIPYCHGMTVGELARFFNGEYNVGCKLRVIPMKGWKRHMTFPDTGRPWIPTSPHIPTEETPLYYPITGILGEMQNVSIGIGYTLPFRVVGAPWIDADLFARQLNRQKFPGIKFVPTHFRPFFGRYAKEECHGVLIQVTDSVLYEPISSFYLILGVLKHLYSKQFKAGLQKGKKREKMIAKLNGTEEIMEIAEKEPFFIWKLRKRNQEVRLAFQKKRKQYLFTEYSVKAAQIKK